MLPLRDLQPRLSRPWVTWAVIALNVGVFLATLALPPIVRDQVAHRFGLIPEYVTRFASGGAWITPLTSMFLHAGVVHLASNMWFLFVFGDNVEDALGPARYAAFYVSCGLVAAATQVAVDPGARVPIVGASGAIAGVLGAYFSLFPRARVMTLTPVLLVIELPAWFFLLFWFALQAAFALLAEHAAGGVAWWAHIGGFVAGLLGVRLVVDSSRLERRARIPPPRGGAA